MKSVSCVVIGVLFLLLTASLSWADPLIGEIDLVNVLAPANGLAGADDLIVFNLTGAGNGGDINDSLTFSNVQVTINGVTTPFGDIPVVGSNDIASIPPYYFIPTDSITDLEVSFTLGTAPFTVTLTADSSQELVSPDVDYTYSGAPLDSVAAGGDLAMSLYATPETVNPVVPEPATAALLGIGVLGLWSIRRRQR
jgi:hypothetical protein